ncbi:MAG: flagellar basal body rod protein FlgC [Clostridiales bacterium]|nr:flagellar basal body rod protein FlgC [Clostridiales bacterium]
MFDMLNISWSGLSAQRFRLDVVAENLANIHSTRTPQGHAYWRQVPIFQEAGGLRGVKVVGLATDPRPGPREYQPGHPDADGDGYVQLPNVDPTVEMVNMLAAARAYQANVTAFEAGKSIFKAALEMGRS